MSTSGYTCDATRNITIRGYGSGKHDGKWDTARYVLRPAANAHALTLASSGFEVIEDLQIEMTAANAGYDIVRLQESRGDSVVSIRRCLFKKSNTQANQNGINDWYSTTTKKVVVEHCVFTASTNSGTALCHRSGRGTFHARNCTIHNFATGCLIYGSAYAEFALHNIVWSACSANMSAGLPATTSFTVDASVFSEAAAGDFHFAGNTHLGTNITTLQPPGVALDFDAQPITVWYAGADAVPGEPTTAIEYSDGHAVIVCALTAAGNVRNGASMADQARLSCQASGDAVPGPSVAASCTAELRPVCSASCGTLAGAVINAGVSMADEIAMILATHALHGFAQSLDADINAGVAMSGEIAQAGNVAGQVIVGVRMDEVYSWLCGWADAAPVAARAAVARFTVAWPGVCRFAVPVRRSVQFRISGLED